MNSNLGLSSFLLSNYLIAIAIASFVSDYAIYVVLVSTVVIWLMRPRLRWFIATLLLLAFITHSAILCDALFQGPLTRSYNERMKDLFLEANLKGASLEETKKVLGEPSYCLMEDGKISVLGYHKFYRVNFGAFKVFFSNNRVSKYKMFDF